MFSRGSSKRIQNLLPGPKRLVVANNDMSEPGDTSSCQKPLSFRDARRPRTVDLLEDHEPVSFAAMLPSEILLSIFKFCTSPADLRACLLVCKTWCRCSVDLLWLRPFLYKTESLNRIIETLDSNSTLFPYASMIKRLNLTILAEYLKDTHLESLSKCNRLERLTLAGCKQISTGPLCRILLNNQRLLALDITGLESITDDVLHMISESCQEIQGLNATNCKLLQNGAVSSVALNCGQLRRVKFSGCELLTDEAVGAVVVHCPQLLEIDLNNCSKITDMSVGSILENLSSLREVRLAFCTLISDTPFYTMQAESYDQLRILDLTSCVRITDDSIQNIVHAAPKLRNLALAKCSNITDRGIKYITKLGKNLHYLHLGHCSAVTDRSISLLAKTCSRLRYIDLACCTQITDNSVIELSYLPKLRRIGLVKCANITDFAILSLVRNKPFEESALERVHLSYCINLTLTVCIWRKGVYGLVDPPAGECVQAADAPQSDGRACVYAARDYAALPAAPAGL
ncbi:SCF E3 ubiquitin ligase complex F-box protein grrA [Neolecta irregularis DAH-3]|uniref:SCF E3 ubiquitin ligase complex F-box protein grrA n=1 Tax=Neolecta irregularis (strain DAH-3) TaxID=1198029 RepID=A0A1U7LS91_NEOID|nr:SCF E3 ubiquitin ligase complex F-box protein grrA [Neolecta irregularis DAH-3]|eukprot:OLL25488.1 SCF E3 ubiquitin ligase complex F-box protein grrA [Neolecta irregularis DAH-3]